MWNKFFKKREPKSSPVEKYLEYLNRIFQVEPEFYALDSLQPEMKGVTSIIYRDIPEAGMLTAVTYGLSLAEHPDWKQGRPELILTVDSSDTAWGKAIGMLANKLRGDCPFSYSNTINFQEKISGGSEMDAFLIFAPSILNQQDFLNIDIGLDYKINLAGAYPIYASEMEVINELGMKDFWHHPDFNMYDVNRKRIHL